MFLHKFLVITLAILLFLQILYVFYLFGVFQQLQQKKLQIDIARQIQNGKIE